MRLTASFTSLSWIPSEAIDGMMRLPFDMGVSHYDEPPPDRLGDLDALREADRFRFANDLRAFVEVTDGVITGYGHEGRGHLGATTLRIGARGVTVAAVQYPDLQQVEEASAEQVRFVQTVGGRTGYPMPRRVAKAPFLRLVAPTVWTTLAMTIHADGRIEREVVGASPFPRHWIYDGEGVLAQKVAVADFGTWSKQSHDADSPWGGAESEAIVTAVETALERQLSVQVMRGDETPEVRSFPSGAVLLEQDTEGDSLALLLDGVVGVEVDGEELVELGPGALIGERALLEGGRRTSTVRAKTPVRVAIASGDHLDRAALAELARGHRAEETEPANRGGASQVK